MEASLGFTSSMLIQIKNSSLRRISQTIGSECMNEDIDLSKYIT
jgi:hypothetical protein